MGDPVTWFDLGAADPAPLKSFYPELFGWTAQDITEGYTILGTGGGAPGGIGRSNSGDPWIAFYVDVADPQATLDRVVGRGGKVVVPVTEIPDIVTFAMFEDPQGLLVGLIEVSEQSGGGPPPRQGAPVDWFEILSSDMTASRELYGDLFDWSFEDMGDDYCLVRTGAETGIGGGLGSSSQGREWATVYARVDDVEGHLRRAERLGGRTEQEPVQVNERLVSAALRDPAGNVIGVYRQEG